MTDKQRTVLELLGLSRVVTPQVRYLVQKHQILEELADNYEPINPFYPMMDGLEDELQHAVAADAFTNLSDGEHQAFRKEWHKMRPDQQLKFLRQYVLGDLS